MNTQETPETSEAPEPKLTAVRFSSAGPHSYEDEKREFLIVEHDDQVIEVDDDMLKRVRNLNWGEEISKDPHAQDEADDDYVLTDEDEEEEIEYFSDEEVEAILEEEEAEAEAEIEVSDPDAPEDDEEAEEATAEEDENAESLLTRIFGNRDSNDHDPTA